LAKIFSGLALSVEMQQFISSRDSLAMLVIEIYTQYDNKSYLCICKAPLMQLCSFAACVIEAVDLIIH
jgi:hypothetical protein